MSPGRQDGRCTSYTDSGASCTGTSPRCAIHSWSRHSWCEAVTIEALAGGTSAYRAIGSARSVCEPSGRQTSNLYSAPSPIPGRKSSHTPEEPSERIGKPVPSQ